MHPDESGRPRLLIIAQWYTPGYKAGGPIRSVQNLVDLLKDTFDIYVFTSDRDHGDDKAYSTIVLNKWMDQNGHFVFYSAPSRLTISFLKSMLREVKPDAVFLNSMFAYRFFLLPLIALNRIDFKGRIILAPRGMLRASALKFKKAKKQIFLLGMRMSGLLKGIYYQATNKEEAKEIENMLNIDPKHVHIMQNVPYAGGVQHSITKIPGEVDLIYLGRIHPIKGLDFLLDVLKNVESKVHLAIVGTIENKDYYASCLQKIRSLPDNVSVDIKYDMPFENAIERMHQSHFLVSPTHGENFGHAIFEAFASGRPAIISDQTPWRGLKEKGIGWDISLNKPEGFKQVIEEAAAMDQYDYNDYCNRAKEFSENYISGSNLKEKYTELFGFKLTTSIT